MRFDMLDSYLAAHTEKELAALVRDSGVRPITLNAIFDINFCEEERWNTILEQFERSCRLGVLLGADCVIALPSPSEGRERHSWEEIREDSVRRLRELATYGKENGMRIAFEPIGARERCVRTVSQAWEIVRETNEPRVGLALDAYNLYLCEERKDWSEIKLLSPERIFIVHVDDAAGEIPREQLGTWDRRMPGDGAADVRGFVRAIHEQGYQGAYSIELLNREYWAREPEELFGEAYRKTKEMLLRAGVS